jgi:hypothetical protein
MAAHLEKNQQGKNKVADNAQKSLWRSRIAYPLKQSQMLLTTALSRVISTYPECVS